MLETWLNSRDLPDTSLVLAVREVTADNALDGEVVRAWLGKELARNYVGAAERRLLEDTFRDLGMHKVAEHLARHKFPTAPVSSGEALSGALFRKVDRWCVPILKLRYKQRPNQPVQGADFLGFRLSRDPAVVTAPEVKTRTTKQLDVGVAAVSSLQGVLDDLPSSIHRGEFGVVLATHVSDHRHRPPA
ncbi:hypothetical protein [Actinoallomurus sp. NPDC050550]|uniref:hypothetical protein n=1 Tax=Actinoallomurus sp. NPDC050550 TaxID=3154937 RepID=UPI0033CA515C